MRILGIAAVLVCCMVLAAGATFAKPEWVARVPNGGVNSCSTCHTTAPTLNAFGTDFLATNPLDPNWTNALAMMDSDQDTFANGIELQDPTGVWTLGDPDPGDAGLVSNPGDDQSVAVEARTWGEIKALFTL